MTSHVLGIEQARAIADRRVVDIAVVKDANVNMIEKLSPKNGVGGTFPPVTHCVVSRRRYCCCDKRAFRMSEVSRLIEC